VKSAEEQVFEGVSEGGQGRGWCRRVGGGMRHTQLRIGVQGGRVEHRGETEVKVIRPEGRKGWEEKTKKQNNPVGKTKGFLVSHAPTRIDRPAESRRL
jgi:hypothetical protein